MNIVDYGNLLENEQVNRLARGSAWVSSMGLETKTGYGIELTFGT